MSTERLRIGVLGAASIAPSALVKPALEVAGVEVCAVAARDPARARAFAERHGIARVHGSYAELIADPEIDAIYNPLPNSHHGEWNLRALEAGKHVLSEKPSAANAEEAERVAERASRSGRVFMEAFHWRYHALAERMLTIVRSGALGRIRRVEASVCFPLPLPGDIRYRLDLAGGAQMDAGCYAVHIVRTLAGEEPEVLRAQAWMASPGVDRAMEAEFRFPSGALGRVRSSLFSAWLLAVEARVEGDRGWLRALNPVAPQFFHRLRWSEGGVVHRERLAGPASYTAQLAAFAAAARSGAPVPTGPQDAVANMRTIDAIYRAAGLEPRAPAASAG